MLTTANRCPRPAISNSWATSCAYYTNVGNRGPRLCGEIRVFKKKDNTPIPPDAVDHAGRDGAGSHRIPGIGNGVRVDPDPTTHAWWWPRTCSWSPSSP
jgi:hypothetical protein